MVLMLGFGVSPAYAFTPEFLGALAGGGVTSCSGILVNGCFSSGTAGWVGWYGGVISVAAGVGHYSQTSTGTYLMNDTVLEDGTYSYSYEVTDVLVSAGTARFWMGTTTKTFLSTPGTYTGTYIATAGDRVYFSFSEGLAGDHLYIDNVIITKN